MSKKDGYPFEKETEALGGKYGRRNWGSGSIGTATGISYFVGDVMYDPPWLKHETISIECKHGYGDTATKKTFRIYKEWFDKHQKQCEAANLLPAYAIKFKGVRDGQYMLIPFSTVKEVLRQVDNLYRELQEKTDELEDLKNEQTK